MIEKVKLFFLFYSENIWRVIKLFTPIILIISIMLFGNQALRNYQLSKLDTQTNGEITYSNKKMGIRQTDEGAKKVVEYYEIRYNYVVNEEALKNEEVIQPRDLSLKEKVKLNQYQIGDTINILYSSSNPKMSMISFQD